MLMRQPQVRSLTLCVNWLVGPMRTRRLFANLSFLLRAGTQFIQSTLELRRKGRSYTALRRFLIRIR
jgi:hypothetical protein